MRKYKPKQQYKGISNTIINLLRRISIYRRLAYSYVLIVIISTLILGSSASVISTQVINTSISKSTQLVLNNLTENLDVKLRTYESLINQLGYNTKLKNLLKDSRDLYANTPNPDTSSEYSDNKLEIGNILYNTTFSRNDISNLEILTDYDEFVERDTSSTVRGAALVDSREYRNGMVFKTAVNAPGALIWFDTSKKNGEFYLTPSINMGYYITLAKAIPSRDSSDTLGVIIMSIPISIFSNMVNLHGLYDKNEVVFLAGENGVVKILNSSFQIHNMPDEKTASKIASMKTGMLSYHNQKTKNDSLLFFSNCSRIDMSIVYMVHKSALYSSIYLIQKIMIIVIILCIVFSMLLAFLVTKSISAPLKSLQYIISHTGDNDLLAVYKDTQKDEIGFLGSQFNEMIHRIQELLKRLLDEEKAHKNEQIKRKEAELNALQMIINPHFIYNTLDLIRWNAMFVEQGNGKVSQMLAAFSKLLRFNTKYMDTLVDIEEELEHVKSYIEVINFKDNFTVTLKIDMSDDAVLNSRLPKLTLQPLVENTVKHGIMVYCTNILVKISIVRKEGMLMISIYDDGCGMDAEQVREINDNLNNGSMPRNNIGLRNVNERIRLYFGEGYGLQIESKEGEFTNVAICIPESINDKTNK